MFIVERRTGTGDAGALILHTCPVRDLHAVDDLLALFDACYRVEVIGFGGLRYQRIGLPIAGGVAEQPAVMMDALEHIERISNDELAAAAARRPRRDRGKTHDDG